MPEGKVTDWPGKPQDDVLLPSDFLLTLVPLPPIPQDFLRCVSAIIIFLVVSFAAVTSRDGAAIAAFVSPALQSSPGPWDPWLVFAHHWCLPTSPTQGSGSHSAPSRPPPSPLYVMAGGFLCVIPAPTHLLPQVFGIILVSVFAYDAFKIYRTEMAPRTTQGECLCHGEWTCPLPPRAPAT